MINEEKDENVFTPKITYSDSICCPWLSRTYVNTYLNHCKNSVIFVFLQFFLTNCDIFSLDVVF